jgi:hypothetical protein
MGHVEQLGRGQQVVVAEVVGVAPAFVGLVTAFELDAVPVAAFGELPLDNVGEDGDVYPMLMC